MRRPVDGVRLPLVPPAESHGAGVRLSSGRYKPDSLIIAARGDSFSPWPRIRRHLRGAVLRSRLRFRRDPDHGDAGARSHRYRSASGVIVFWPVWWAWTQFTWSLNEADTETPAIRLTTLVATALAFIMATSLPVVATEFGWLFPLAYLVVRVVGIWLQWLLVEDDAGWSSWSGAGR